MSPEKDEEYTITYKSYQDYFTDLNITKETITTRDLTGSGSENDPYIVHSTRGFLYLSNNNLAGFLNNKFISLNCDVFLNQETFDKEGVPSGGDGVVYSWQPIANAKNITLNGNGKTIYGLHINDETLTHTGLFHRYSTFNLENLNIKNVFNISKSLATVFGTSGKNFSNVNVFSGTIVATEGVANVFSYHVKNAENCKNYIDITAYQYASGMFGTNSNYKETSIKNCINYGSVYSASHVAGFISRVTYPYGYSRVVLENCVNYGDMMSKATTSSNSAGGLIGSVATGEIFVFGCKSYGSVYRAYSRDTAAGFIGNAGGDALTSITFENCLLDIDVSKGNAYLGFLGHNSVEKGVVIKNCSVKLKNCPNGNFGIISGYCGKSFFEVKNLTIETDGENDRTQICLILSASPSKVGYANLEGVCFKSKWAFYSSLFRLKHSGSIWPGEVKAKSLIVETPTGCYYMGSDFSTFAYSWKTGKLSLLQHGANKFYQGKVTEEWLINKGYQKREF